MISINSIYDKVKLLWMSTIRSNEENNMQVQAKEHGQLNTLQDEKLSDYGKFNKVVGGRLATKGEVPYIVSLHSSDAEHDLGHFCGGTIFNEKFIITAAHCFDGADPKEKVRITAGALNLRELDGNEQVIGVKHVTIHPEYDENDDAIPNDIAILELEKELQFNDTVQPIPIPPKGTKSSGKAKLSGWGSTKIRKFDSPKDDGEDALRTVDFVIVPGPACDKYYDEVKHKDVFRGKEHSTEFGLSHAPETNMCAGDLLKGGKGSCQGDSGGPLVCSRRVGDKVEKYLCGVVSSGYGCGLTTPSEFTEVAKFHDWILETVKKANPTD